MIALSEGKDFAQESWAAMDLSLQTDLQPSLVIRLGAKGPFIGGAKPASGVPPSMGFLQLALQ